MKRAFILAFIHVLPCAAQIDSLRKQLDISAYADLYYSYDFSIPANHLRPPFFYSYNKHNEVNLNLAFIQASYRNNVTRSTVAFMLGTYAQYNLASEGQLFQHLMEASVGVRLCKASNVWLDAGIMPSHIGFESAVGKTCWTLTRSILADNSPYYECGVKIGYTSGSEKIYVAAMLLNGWQRIRRIAGNQTPAFGTQVTVKPSSRITLNWSTYAGNEFPDSTMRWRYFSNLYCQMTPARRSA